MSTTKALSLVEQTGRLVGEVDSLTQQLLAARETNAHLRHALRDTASELEAEAVRHERVADKSTPYWSPTIPPCQHTRRAAELRTLAKRLRAIEVSR